MTCFLVGAVIIIVLMAGGVIYVGRDEKKYKKALIAILLR